jgi:DNA-binding response OmpR family regulator
MPDMDGIQVLRKMKEKKPRLPIIMSTAYDYRDDFAVWASEAYVVKSSDTTELKETIRRLLNK